VSAAAESLRRVRVVVVLAAVAEGLGWILPVVDDYRGWQAFRVALSPLWPFAGIAVTIPPGSLLVLSVASALTNVVFVAVAVALAMGFANSRLRAQVLLWTAAAAALVNCHWPSSMGAMSERLALGYFVWVGAFVLLTLAAVVALRAQPRRMVNGG
jgi:hypothetical protein